MVRPLSHGLRSKPLSIPIDRFFDHPSIIQDTHPVAPWDNVSIPIPWDWSLAKYRKHVISSTVLYQEFLEIQAHYEGYCEIYSDGVKFSLCVGCVVFSQEFASVKRLPL